MVINRLNVSLAEDICIALLILRIILIYFSLWGEIIVRSAESILVGLCIARVADISIAIIVLVCVSNGYGLNILKLILPFRR